jgi:tetratricopeptide (TPR) repeat protein
MTEHVHPNIEGHFLMAEAFFNEVTASGILGELNPIFYKSSAYYKRNWGYTELDSLVAVHIVELLKTNWPFQSPESTSAEYRRNYIPSNFVDSLAFSIAAMANITIEDGHILLAEEFVQNGEFYKAFKEYYANVKYDPYNEMNYNNAIHCLTYINDFSLALKLVNRSLELKETFYAYYIKGEILFLKSDYEAALKAMYRAAELEDRMEVRLQILISLHKLYYYMRNETKTAELLKEIRKVNKDFQPDYPADKKNFVFYIPVQVEENVKKAFHFYEDGKQDLALNLFLKTLEIKETSLANRCVGDILRNQKDSLALIYYQKAYPDCSKDIDFLFEMSILYLEHQQINNAQVLLDEIKKIDPEFNKLAVLEKEIQTMLAGRQ